MKESVDFNCPMEVDRQIDIINTDSKTQKDFPGFTFEIESDGSLSLVVKEV